MKKRRTFAISAFAALFCLGQNLPARTWTEASSGRTLEADFVKTDGPNVIVRLAGGAISSLPLSRLSKADQEFIAAQDGQPASPARTAESGQKPASSSTSKTYPAKDAADKDLIGTWNGYMADSDGSRHGDIRLVITGEKITASNPQGDRLMGAGTYKIRGRNIDATGTDGQFAGKHYEGIFELDGRTLRWCSANDNPSSQRPSRFQSNPQAGQFLMVLEKAGS